MVEILDCPFSKQIKDGLLNWFQSEEQKEVSGYTLQTKEYNEPQTPEIQRLFEWIESIVNDVADKLASHTRSLYTNPNRWFNRNFKIDTYWGLSYNQNSSVFPHNHFPHALSFGYYINVPVGSSPFTLLIDGEEDRDYHPKDGQLFVFNGSTKHVVHPNPVGGRKMIAGDIAYLSRFIN